MSAPAAPMPPEFLPYKREARARWQQASPFRVGYLIGLAGESLPNPYENARGIKNYAEGMRHGRGERRQLERLALANGGLSL